MSCKDSLYILLIRGTTKTASKKGKGKPKIPRRPRATVPKKPDLEIEMVEKVFRKGLENAKAKKSFRELAKNKAMESDVIDVD